MEKNIYKAYNNKEFLNCHAARPIRVLCELIEPEERLRENEVEDTIVFFGSARPKPQGLIVASGDDAPLGLILAGAWETNDMEPQNTEVIIGPEHGLDWS